jgi:hypothetical protein
MLFFSRQNVIRILGKKGDGSRILLESYSQCWTEGRSSTAVAEDLRPTATATVAEV